MGTRDTVGRLRRGRLPARHAGAVRHAPVALAHLDDAWVAPLARAYDYLARVPRAIAGQHGDLHTFRVCCRIVRGFALADDDAVAVLRAWNARCEPPWSDAALRAKVRHARQYGREPVGGLIDAGQGRQYISLYLIWRY